MVNYRLFKISDIKPVLIDFNGKDKFVDFDELIFNLCTTFNIKQHQFYIEAIDDCRPKISLYLNVTAIPKP